MLIGADFFLSHRVYVSNAQKRIFFTYNGGPVFDLSVRKAEAMAAADAKTMTAPGTGDAAGGPATAQEFSLRGNARAARSDFKGALADLTRAVDLAPDNAEYRYQRALVLVRTGKFDETRADLDRALKLKPAYPEALLMRAGMRFREDKAGARADIEAADHVLSESSDMRLSLGGYYEIARRSGFIGRPI